MTVKEVVENVVKELSNISVPVGQMQQIGLPIARSIDRLNAVLAAWEYEEQQAKKAENEAGEPRLELVAEPADEAPAEEYAEEAPNEEN